MLPVRSRENGTIIAHNRYLVLVMSLPADGTPLASTNLSSLNEDDLLEAMIKLQGSSEAIFGKR